MSFAIATWNVNSLKVRLPHLLEWLAAHRPDVVAVQEIKCEDAKFPAADVRAAGYAFVSSGQKTYNGVAILAREPDTLGDVVHGLPGYSDEQKRVWLALSQPPKSTIWPSCRAGLPVQLSASPT